MVHVSKRMKNSAAKVKSEDPVPVDQAVALLKQFDKTKFDQSVEIAVRLGIDAKQDDQRIRGSLVLPHGIGKSLRVLVFAKGDNIALAEAAGADHVGGDDLAKKIKEGWTDFDVCIAAPDMMGIVGPLGKVLGPRGLMPNPKTGTVTADVRKAVQEIKAGKVEFRVDKTGIIHAPVGKTSFATETLVENAHALVDSVVKAKPSAAKGKYLKSVTLSSTMGPGIAIDTAHIDERVKH